MGRDEKLGLTVVCPSSAEHLGFEIDNVSYIHFCDFKICFEDRPLK